jgi:hypothetical protein
MNLVANPARSVDVVGKAAVLVDAGDSRSLGASLLGAGTALDVRSARCHRDKSRALASNSMRFLGNCRGEGVAAIATLQRMVPFRGFRIGAVRREAARRSAWLR